MTETPENSRQNAAAPPSAGAQSVGPNDIIRFLLEIVAVVSLAIWGFTQWPLPWPGVAFGIGAPLLAILLWALFLSPKAVFQLDAFGRALIEIVVMGSVAIVWWQMGQPIVAAAFALLATVSGVISGRNRI